MLESGAAEFVQFISTIECCGMGGNSIPSVSRIFAPFAWELESDTLHVKVRKRSCRDQSKSGGDDVCVE